jgi:hypothetical protein
MRDRTKGVGWLEFYGGLARRRGEPPAVSPYNIPGINSAEDANIILSGMGRAGARLPDVETPPAHVAEAGPVAAPDVPKPKRRQLSKAERLERKAAKLRAEIERLRK